MPTIFEMFNAAEIAAYWNEGVSNQIAYLGNELFPDKKQVGLDLSWIKGAAGLPVALKPSAFDTKATLRDRIGVDKIETELPFFKEAMLIKEKDRQEILKLTNSAPAMMQPIMQRIFDDAAGLIAGARVTRERMQMQLISTGKISIIENRVPYAYDFLHPAGNKETLAGGDAWSDPTAPVVTQIRDWQTTIQNLTGTKPTRAICNSSVWALLMTNVTIKLDIDRQNGSNLIMTDDLLRNYFINKLGLDVVVYDKMYSLDVAQTSKHKFFPDNIFSLIPPGAIGNFYYGTSPEEADLLTGNNKYDVQIVDTGVAIATNQQFDPVNVETKVSFVGLPSAERIDEIFIAEVA